MIVDLISTLGERKDTAVIQGASCVGSSLAFSH